MSLLPMNGQGSYQSAATRIARQRALAAQLRTQSMKTPQGEMIGGGGGGPFGERPSIYVAPHWAEQLAPLAAAGVSAWGDRQADKAEIGNENQARTQAQEAYKNFPTIQGTRFPRALGMGQAGPERSPEMLATPETFQRTQPEYQQAIAEYATSLPQGNPYLGDLQGKMLEKSMNMASDQYKQEATQQIKQVAITKAQQDPNSLKEYLAGHPGADMSNPDTAADYMDFVTTSYRGNSAQKNAKATGLPVAKILEFAQNPAKASRVTAELARLDAAEPGLYQEADSQGLTGQARADYVSNRKEQLTNQILSNIDHEFSLGGGQTPQQASPQQALPQSNPSAGGFSANDFAEPIVPPGPEVKTALRMPSDTQLSPLEIAEIQSQANQGNAQAIAAAKQFGIPVGGKGIPKSVEANKAVLPSTPSVLPLTTGRPTMPATDPAKLAGDKKSAQDAAEIQQKAIATLPSLEASVETVDRHVKELTAMPGYKNIGRVYGALTKGITNTIGVSTDMGDIEARVEQLKGEALKPAYDALRGSGSVATAEGAAATTAYNRMKTSSSVEEFTKALADFQLNLKKALEVQRKLAAGTGAVTTPSVGAQPRVVDW